MAINLWHDMAPNRVGPDEFIAVMEISKGSKTKYELDKETGAIILDRILYTSTHYPANYGFIPKTYADDNDPLDVLVLCTESLAPLTLVHCYPIGVISMIDNGDMDQKIIAIPFEDPTYSSFKTMSDLPSHLFDQMRHFFQIYKSLENKETAVNEVEGPEEAKKVIRECLAAYKEKFPLK